MMALCPVCKRRLTVLPVLSEKKFWRALDNDEEIEVMHLSESGDHRWKLTDRDKQNVLNAKARGSL
jgi:hypothetical protein